MVWEDDRLDFYCGKLFGVYILARHITIYYVGLFCRWLNLHFKTSGQDNELNRAVNWRPRAGRCTDREPPCPAQEGLSSSVGSPCSAAGGAYWDLDPVCQQTSDHTSAPSSLGLLTWAKSEEWVFSLITEQKAAQAPWDAAASLRFF